MGSTRLERAVGVKPNPERGGHVRDVYVKVVTVGQAADAVIEVALNYENKDTGPCLAAIRSASSCSCMT